MHIVHEKVAFSRGVRTYFVEYNISHVPTGTVVNNSKIIEKLPVLNHNELYLTYGACIYKHTKNSPTIPNSIKRSHFNTAHIRYNNFAVSTIIIIDSLIKTRLQWNNFLIGKYFENILIKLFCKNSVRCRKKHITSLKEHEYNNCIMKILKNIRRVDIIYYQQRKKYISNHDNDILSRISGAEIGSEWTSNELLRISEIPIFKLLFIINNRIFHISYQRLCNGKTRYGACIFHPTSENDWNNYNEEEHFITSYNRMLRFGVEVNIPDINAPLTRLRSSGQITYWNTNIIDLFRNHIARYGVRVRTDSRHSHRFLKEHEINTKEAMKLKYLNRTLNTLYNIRSKWKKVRTINNVVYK